MRRQTRPRTADVYIVVSKNGSRVGRLAAMASEPSTTSIEESARRDTGRRFLLLPVIGGRDRLQSERELVDGFCAADGHTKVAS